MGPRVLRYALPAVPGLCLFAAYGLSEIEDWAASRSWSMALRLLVIGTLFLNAGQIFLVALKDFNPFESALGLEKSEDYLLRRGVNTARAAAWLKDKAGPNPSLVLLGGFPHGLPPPPTNPGCHGF